MKEAKLVFVQASKEDSYELAQLLSDIKQTEFMFFIVPPDVNVLTKKAVIEMLNRIPDCFTPE